MAAIPGLYCMSSVKETDVWNDLISRVRTTYVFIGRGVLKFTEFTQLESLVDVINQTMSVVVSSATKDLHTGQVIVTCAEFDFNDVCYSQKSYAEEREAVTQFCKYMIWLLTALNETCLLIEVLVHFINV